MENLLKPNNLPDSRARPFHKSVWTTMSFCSASRGVSVVVSRFPPLANVLVGQFGLWNWSSSYHRRLRSLFHQSRSVQVD